MHETRQARADRRVILCSVRACRVLVLVEKCTRGATDTTPLEKMGRAPTSGYCHTCRQRRIKCDKGRPECQCCIRSGRKCAGYESVLRMQSHGVVAGAVPGTSRLAKVQTATSFPSTIDAGPSSLALRRQREPREESALSSRRRLARESRCLVTILPRSLHLAGFADNMALSYFFESYGWINMHSILLQDNTMRGGLDDKGLVYDCLRALCYGLLGRDQSIVSLQTAGRTMFARAIQSLRAQITTTSKAELAALVKPISLMGSYSVPPPLPFSSRCSLTASLDCGRAGFTIYAPHRAVTRA